MKHPRNLSRASKFPACSSRNDQTIESILLLEADTGASEGARSSDVFGDTSEGESRGMTF